MFHNSLTSASRLVKKSSPLVLSNRNTLQTQYRFLTTSHAFDLLHISNKRDSNTPLSYQELRNAYFKAAKKCHPDVYVSSNGNHSCQESAAKMFLNITEAYEYLLDTVVHASSSSSSVNVSDEEEVIYREACESWLGLPAEVVEETKRCPLFRQFLLGKTDSAARWNMFLCLNGGLAPQLREEKVLLIEQGTRRRRR